MEGSLRSEFGPYLLATDVRGRELFVSPRGVIMVDAGADSASAELSGTYGTALIDGSLRSLRELR